MMNLWLKNILSIGTIMIAMILIVKILLKKEDDGRDEDGRYPADHPSQDFWHEDGFSPDWKSCTPPEQDTITFDFGTSDQGMVNFGASTTSTYGRYFWWCWN